MAVKEIRRIGLFGLTESEVARYKQGIHFLFLITY